MAAKHSARTYNAVAGTIARRYRTFGGAAGRIAMRELARDFAERFGADNPRFDRARFMAACGLD